MVSDRFSCSSTHTWHTTTLYLSHPHHITVQHSQLDTMETKLAWIPLGHSTLRSKLESEEVERERESVWDWWDVIHKWELYSRVDGCSYRGGVAEALIPCHNCFQREFSFTNSASSLLYSFYNSCVYLKVTFFFFFFWWGTVSPKSCKNSTSPEKIIFETPHHTTHHTHIVSVNKTKKKRREKRIG